MITDEVESTTHPGWVWPKADTKTWDFLEAELELVEWVTSFVKQRRTMVQAGGNCGLYVRRYAELFDQVHTFEPQAVPFHCLVRNVPLKNTYFYRAALGEEGSSVMIVGDPDHTGAGRVGGSGCIPMLCLDSFDFQWLDLIHLDCEGGELDALMGAAASIRRHRPVIALEVNEQGQRNGWTWGIVNRHLEFCGYHHAGNLHQEHVWLPND